MTKRDEVFRGGLAMLGLTFNREIVPALADVYWSALKDLREPELTAAFARALRECKFFPAPIELLMFAGHTARNLAAEAALAWGAVRAALDSLDVYGNPDFGRVVNATVRNVGGWLYLCEAPLRDLEFRRRDFERVYQVLAVGDPARLDGAPLVGQWADKLVTPIEIPGLPREARAIDAPSGESVGAISGLVRELAEAKS